MDLQIAVDARTASGKQTKRLRAEGIVPGVLFGKKTGSIPVQLDAKAFEALYREAGRTTIVKVTVDGGSATSAVIKSVQRNPLTGRAIHVDFFAPDLTHEMQADVPINFTGTAPGVEADRRLALHLARPSQGQGAAGRHAARVRGGRHVRWSTWTPRSWSATWWSTGNFTILNEAGRAGRQGDAAARRDRAGAGAGRGAGGRGCRGRRRGRRRCRRGGEAGEGERQAESEKRRSTARPRTRTLSRRCSSSRSTTSRLPS